MSVLTVLGAACILAPIALAALALAEPKNRYRGTHRKTRGGVWE